MRVSGSVKKLIRENEAIINNGVSSYKKYIEELNKLKEKSNA